MKKVNQRILNFQKVSAVPMMSMTISVLKYWGFIYEPNWKRYFSLILTTMFNMSQFFYVCVEREALDIIIRNAYMLVLWFNTILRAYKITLEEDKFEEFLTHFLSLYYPVLESKDKVVTDLMKSTNTLGKTMSFMNMSLGLMTSLGFCIYPLFAEIRMLPYGIVIPFVDELKDPTYYFVFIYQVVITPIGCFMYIAFGNLIVALMMFAIVMCKILQYRLRELTAVNNSVDKKVKWCIKYQKCIIEYVSIINSLTTNIFLVEFLCFGACLCGLLFLINIAETTAQVTIACIQISMIFLQIFTLYWFASQLEEESGKVANAAYDSNWFLFDKPVQKNVLMLIMRAQRPCEMTVGNIYPMSLEMFQSLLNTSYSYFTLLRRFYG